LVGFGTDTPIANYVEPYGEKEERRGYDVVEVW
jgi:hypothetical protein